jgi:hypothetical protein
LSSFNAVVQSKINKYASREHRYGSGVNKYASGEDTRHINMTQLDNRMANMGWCVHIYAYTHTHTHTHTHKHKHTHTHKYASGDDTKDINMNQPHGLYGWCVCICVCVFCVYLSNTFRS